MQDTHVLTNTSVNKPVYNSKEELSEILNSYLTLEQCMDLKKLGCDYKATACYQNGIFTKEILDDNSNYINGLWEKENIISAFTVQECLIYCLVFLKESNNTNSLREVDYPGIEWDILSDSFSLFELYKSFNNKENTDETKNQINRYWKVMQVFMSDYKLVINDYIETVWEIKTKKFTKSKNLDFMKLICFVIKETDPSPKTVEDYNRGVSNESLRILKKYFKEHPILLDI
jgi:hypothetical protein